MSRHVESLSSAFASFRCVMFDLDGTLVDSSKAHRQAHEQALVELAPDLLPAFRYAPGRRTLDYFTELAGPGPLARELAQAKQANYRRAAQRGHIQQRPFAAEVLDLASSVGLPCVVVTAASRESASMALASAGLASRIRGMITGDDVVMGKPHPEGYLKACERWDVLPADAVAIEDSMDGVNAAISAGLAVYQVYPDARAAGAVQVDDLLGLYSEMVES